MPKRPNPRADMLRQAVAEEAARIMREQGVDDFLLAKRKAAERLGVTDASILPRNTEIEAARVAHQRLFAADRHEADLATLRRTALEAMRLMADFEPRLVGASMGPGTARTSTPWSAAWRAVTSEPLRSRASTTTTARPSALIRRLRSGKYGARGGVPQGSSVTTAPRPATRPASRRWAAG